MTGYRTVLIGVIVVCALVAAIAGGVGHAYGATTIPAEFRVWEGTPENGRQWDTDLDGRINVFSSGALARDAAQRDVFAPGTEGSYLFTIESASPAAITYALDISESNPSAVPIGVRLRTAGGTYIAGSATGWIPAHEARRYISMIDPHSAESFVLDWRWLYEVSPEQDLIDTALGTQASHETVPYDLTVTIDAETGATEGETSAGLVATRDLLPVAVLVMAGAALITMIIGTSTRRRRESRDE